MRTIEKHFAKTVGLSVLLGGALAVSGCKSNTAAPIVDMNNGPDPAAANMAAAGASSAPATGAAPVTRVMGQQSYGPPAQANGEQYAETSNNSNYDPNEYNDTAYDQSQVDQGAQALYAQEAPPPLPEYQQPELTEPGDIWTPGYWAYGRGGYYWVPGAWVAPPYSGSLWTPAYWGYEGRRYRFHGGYWGSHIGFYGGVSYGFGYFGHGYEGGYWNGGNFYYNQRVNRINVENVRNVYVRNVTVVNTRVSYNGPGGVQARPLPAEVAVLHERRVAPMQVQVAQVRAASTNRAQAFAENHGRPAVVVAPQRFAADRTPAAEIPARPSGGVPAHAGPAENQQQIRAQQGQQQIQRNQQAEQQHAVQQQQQRSVQEQRAPQPQQRAAEPARVAPQPQRVAPEPQRMAPEPQRMAPQPQRVAPQPERTAPAARPEPQRAAPQPERAPAPAPRVPQEARPQPEARPAAPAPRAAPAPAPRAAPTPAPRAAPAQAPHAPPAQAPHPPSAPHPPAEHYPPSL